MIIHRHISLNITPETEFLAHGIQTSTFPGSFTRVFSYLILLIISVSLTSPLPLEIHNYI